jgi:DNA-binding NarL/FixJ family response regulator
MWEWLAEMVPDKFEQTVLRRPDFRRMTGRMADRNGRHGDCSTCPTGEEYKDEMRFMGWSWVCPGCRKTVKKIYYPLAPRTLFDYLGYDPGRSKSCRTQSQKYQPYDVHDMPKPPGTFACAACHGVVTTSRAGGTAWNDVVSWLSRGMLYGHEVEKPQWYVAERKVARHRKLGKPAVKREAVFNRLRAGWPVEEIALKLLMSKGAVAKSIHRICRQERVRNRAELAAKLGWAHAQPLNGREKIRQMAKEREELVEKLLLEGLGYKEIRERLNLRGHNVEEAAMRIYRKHGIVIVRKRARKAFMERFGVGEKGGGHEVVSASGELGGGGGRTRVALLDAHRKRSG